MFQKGQVQIPYCAEKKRQNGTDCFVSAPFIGSVKQLEIKKNAFFVIVLGKKLIQNVATFLTFIIWYIVYIYR